MRLRGAACGKVVHKTLHGQTVLAARAVATRFRARPRVLTVTLSHASPILEGRASADPTSKGKLEQGLPETPASRSPAGIDTRRFFRIE